MTNRYSRSRGFTLFDILTAILIVGILAGIAIPTYQSQVRAGRRADAKTALADLANRMERYYRDNNTYATATIAAGAGTDVLSSATSRQGFYTLSISAATATTYSVLATRAGTQTNDTLCGDYTLTSASVRTISGSGTVAQCW